MQGTLMESAARVPTEVPRRYLVQLCKHFEHRLDVAYEGDRGSIMFGSGCCLLQAETGALLLRVQAPDAGQLAQLQDVVARHLIRFAFRAPPLIVWQAGGE